ncbi:MAG: selenocysteine-specific translation elongation factor [Armatimonadetes bacterium]|nr:selenocysteine-specific translation elongation factor [Armatimonadota bacterium]
MAYLIGTAGHVDHGKTTLIAALTGIDADRLPEEKARGMTIDLGFAYIELPEIGRVSIVDVPGHERFIKNMLAGASGVDVALLCIAADEGVMPQTREHFQILYLLEARRVVVALTKCDLADGDSRALAELDVRDLLTGSPYAGAPILEVSAHTGDGLTDLKDALAKALASLGPREQTQSWFLPIDRVFTVAGHGTVVTGTLAAGTIKPGIEGELMPGSAKVRIRGIQTHGQQADHAEAGQRTALNVAGIRKEALHRGQAVGARGALFETTCVNVRLAPVADIKHGQRVRLHVGAGEFLGKLFLFDEAPGFGQIRLEGEIACAQGQRAVIRKYSPPTVLAGAEIVTPNAQTRRKSDKQIAGIAGGAGGSAAGLPERIMVELKRWPTGAETETICEALGQSPQALGVAFESLKQDGKALGFAGRWLDADQYKEFVERIRAATMTLHGQNPQAAAVSKNRVVAESGIEWQPKAFDRLTAKMAEDGQIELHRGDLRHPNYKISLNEKQAALLDRTLSVMKLHGAVAPSMQDLALEVCAPPQAVSEMIRLGVETKQIIKVEENLFYPVETLDELKRKLRSLPKTFTVAEFRDVTGSSRKYALPILQYFDETKITKRIGDERVVIG